LYLVGGGEEGDREVRHEREGTGGNQHVTTQSQTSTTGKW